MRAKIFRRGRGVINLKNWKVSFFGSSCGRSAYSGGTKKITFAVFWDQMLPKWPKNNWKSSFWGVVYEQVGRPRRVPQKTGKVVFEGILGVFLGGRPWVCLTLCTLGLAWVYVGSSLGLPWVYPVEVPAPSQSNLCWFWLSRWWNARVQGFSQNSRYSKKETSF